MRRMRRYRKNISEPNSCHPELERAGTDTARHTAVFYFGKKEREDVNDFWLRMILKLLLAAGIIGLLFSLMFFTVMGLYAFGIRL